MLVADEEDEATPNDGSLVPFLALLTIYDFFFPAPPCQHMGRRKKKTKATKLSIKTVTIRHCLQSLCVCVSLLYCIFVGVLKSSHQG